MSRTLSAVPPEGVRVESRPYDSTQEIRAMILGALPYPPLPIVMEQLDDEGKIVGETIQTSHDILSNLLLHACARDDPKENERRRKQQQEVLQKFVRHMCDRGELQPVPELYETYVNYTALHVATYLPQGSSPLPFRPATLASVCKGDPTHRRMCDYMAGQAILLEEPNGTSAQEWFCREYADMLVLNRARLVHERFPEEGRFQDADPDEDEGEQQAAGPSRTLSVLPEPDGAAILDESHGPQV